MIKIDDKILSIPPYISTRWESIAALHMKGNILAITLVDGDTIHVPGLTSDLVEKIFDHHAIFLEKDHGPKPTQGNGQLPFHIIGEMGEGGENGFRVGFNSFDGLVGTAMQHNPEQANIPDLPPEILTKISTVAKILNPDDPQLLPKPEPHCNCIYCQIARAILNGVDKSGQTIELAPEMAGEEVKEEELEFQQWDVQQSGDKLFTVHNRLDPKEQYNVFLGSPVGCTCGKANCEHIVAVLKS